MIKLNENYLKLPGSYLFSTIAKKVSELITLAFGQRRKTLLNAVSEKYPKEKVSAVLEECGIRTDIRGEKLSAADFCRITDLLSR